MKAWRGFTIIEVMVVVAVIGILAAALYVNFDDARRETRNQERQADLRTMQTAIELYKQRHGRYPEGCNAANSWSGQPGSGRACPSDNPNYIAGTVDRPFVPNFMTRLPVDPRVNEAGDGGYMYQTNPDGSVYKLIAWKTVEGDDWLSDTRVVTYNGAAAQRFLTHPFRNCDVTPNNRGFCDRMSTQNNSGNVMPYCGIADATGRLIYTTTYAVWGGLATESFGFVHAGAPGGQARAQENTERIMCDDPSNTRW